MYLLVLGHGNVFSDIDNEYQYKPKSVFDYRFPPIEILNVSCLTNLLSLTQ